MGAYAMSRAWMPLYWGDYLRDTRDLSTLQHGAYLLLIAHYWQHGALPTDARQLAAIAGVPIATWRRIAPAIAAKFGPDWRHKRVDAEIVRTERAIVQRRIAGQKGGARSAITRAIAVGSALAAAQARARPPSARSAATESECALDSSFGAYSNRRTGAHAGSSPGQAFAGICAGAASPQADGAAKTQQPASIHNHNQNLASSSSELSAAREDTGQGEQPEGIRSKRPHELTLAEIDAFHARRRGGAS